MSKGSNQRPTDKKQFDENYDRIFGRKKQEQPKDPAFVGFYDDMGRPIPSEGMRLNDNGTITRYW